MVDTAAAGEAGDKKADTAAAARWAEVSAEAVVEPVAAALPIKEIFPHMLLLAH